MFVLEPKVHSFIVKLWLESAEGDEQVTWTGHVTHVPSGERAHLAELDEIQAFIKRRLEQEGVKVRRQSRIRRFIKRLGLNMVGRRAPPL